MAVNLFYCHPLEAIPLVVGGVIKAVCDNQAKSCMGTCIASGGGFLSTLSCNKCMADNIFYCHPSQIPVVVGAVIKAVCDDQARSCQGICTASGGGFLSTLNCNKCMATNLILCHLDAILTGAKAPTVVPTGISTKAPTKPVAIPTGGAATRCYCKPSCNINSQCYYSDLPVPYAVSCLVTFCKTVNPTVVPTSPYTGGSNATPTKKPSGGGDNGGNNKCVQVCREGVGQLSNCTPPEADGTVAVSICNIAGRVETCGGSQFCCPVAEGKWTLDMTKCPDITPTVSPGQDSVLNYKIAFGGVNPNSAQCVVNWPLQFIVLGGGESMVYTDIVPEIKTVVGNRLVFSGSLVLTGFSKTSDVAVFISGPKHLQVKYGKNNQSDAYNQAGGELVLTADVSTSPVYDFSNYPIIPGDVVGVNSDFSDGWINGVDFAYVKTKSLVHETVAEGGYLKGDLDGNCQVNSNDVNLLKISLQDKQGQLY